MLLNGKKDGPRSVKRDGTPCFCRSPLWWGIALDRVPGSISGVCTGDPHKQSLIESWSSGQSSGLDFITSEALGSPVEACGFGMGSTTGGLLIDTLSPMTVLAWEGGELPVLQFESLPGWCVDPYLFWEKLPAEERRKFLITVAATSRTQSILVLTLYKQHTPCCQWGVGFCLHH